MSNELDADCRTCEMRAICVAKRIVPTETWYLKRRKMFYVKETLNTALYSSFWNKWNFHLSSTGFFRKFVRRFTQYRFLLSKQVARGVRRDGKASFTWPRSALFRQCVQPPVQVIFSQPNWEAFSQRADSWASQTSKWCIPVTLMLLEDFTTRVLVMEVDIVVFQAIT